MSVALLEEWKERLRMQDWTIVLEDCCDPAHMTTDDPDIVGHTEWEEASRTAKVQIISPDLYGKRVTPFDYEQILVHELMHLKTSLITDNGNALQDRITHQLVEDLACALVDAKRHNLP